MLRSSLVLFALLAACGGKTIDPLDDGGTTDGSPKKDVVVLDVALPDVTPPNGCNTLDPGTKAVPVNQVASDAPPFASSNELIQPGLYELESSTIYTGPNGSGGNAGTITAELRVNIANSADYIFQIATVQDQQAISRSNSSANDVGPGSMVITQTCPSQDTGTKVLYSADSSSFTIRVDTGTETAEEKFSLIGQ